MTLADNTENTIRKMRLTTRALTDQRILNDAYAELEKSSSIVNEYITQYFTMKKIIKIASLAAIVIISISIFSSKFSDAKTAPKKIYNTLLSNENFCISSYKADAQEPFQEIWVSQSLDMKLFKTKSEGEDLLTFWDIPRDSMLVSLNYTDNFESELITEQMLAELEESIISAFSLNQFTNLKKIPRNAKWHEVNDINILNLVPNAIVFELIYAKAAYIKWRIFLDKATNLPKRMEVHVKDESDDQYKLEIKAVIRENFGPVITTPEFIPTGRYN